ncbi:MAG: HAD hydrolase family protein [Myxococcales bacterium]|nr:HAD hydrolase family protein [Myxococcales bacterium]
MLVVDLDGTALHGFDRLRPEDVEAALELKRLGVHVTIATGRLLAGTRWVAEALGVDGTVAVMNGSSRFDVGRDTVVHADAFALDVQAGIAEVLEAHGVAGFLFGLEAIHVHRDHEHFHDYLRIWTPTLVEHEGEAWHRASDTLAIGGVGEHERVHAAGRQLAGTLPAVATKFFDTFRGERFVELRASHHDKGTALRAMAAERGLEPADVVAVGDWWNDIPMLEVAGQSWAMGGATPEVVAVADGQLDARTREGGAIAELARRIWDVR